MAEAQQLPPGWTALPGPAEAKEGQALPLPEGWRPAAEHEVPTPPGTAAANVSTQLMKGVPVAGPLIAEPFHAAVGALVPGLGEPGETVEERYNKNLAARKKETKKFEEAHPIESTALQATGGTAALAPLAATSVGAKLVGSTGPVLTGRVLPSSMSGGVVGAGDAWARGQDPGLGGGIGATLGAVAPVAGIIGGKYGGALTDQVLKAVGRVKPPSGALAGVDPMALAWAARAAKADGLTDEQIARRVTELGPEGFLMEFGPNMRGLGGAVAAKPGEGKTAVREAIGSMTPVPTGRAGQYRDMIDRSLTETLGPRANVPEYTRFLREQRAAGADPWYEQFRSLRVPITPELQALMPRLEEVGALREGRHLMAAEGKDHLQALFPGGPEVPTAEAWDYAKRGVDAAINRHKPVFLGGTSPDPNRVRVYTDLKHDLLRALESHPDQQIGQVYRQARQEYAEPSELMSALEAGQKWREIHKDELPYILQSYSPQARKAFVQGVRSDLDDLLNDTARGATRTRDLIRAPSTQRKLEHLADIYSPGKGAENAEGLARRADQLHGYAETESKVGHNSETAQRLEMGRMIEPNPENLLLHRASHMYGLHVTPNRYLIPRSVIAEEEAQQAARFDEARGHLGPLLTRPVHGGEAADTARALMGYREPRSLNPAIAHYLNVLQHGAEPSVAAGPQRPIRLPTIAVPPP